MFVGEVFVEISFSAPFSISAVGEFTAQGAVDIDGPNGGCEAFLVGSEIGFKGDEASLADFDAIGGVERCFTSRKD